MEWGFNQAQCLIFIFLLSFFIQKYKSICKCVPLQANKGTHLQNPPTWQVIGFFSCEISYLKSWILNGYFKKLMFENIYFKGNIVEPTVFAIQTQQW